MYKGVTGGVLHTDRARNINSLRLTLERDTKSAKKNSTKKLEKTDKYTTKRRTNVGPNAIHADVSTRGSKTNLAKRSVPNNDDSQWGHTITRHEHNENTVADRPDERRPSGR
jgi:hypothetical protein